MKKTLHLSILLIFTLIAFTSPLFAQDIQKEMFSLAKKYEKAYNNKDSKTLIAFYSKDATRTNPDGTVNTGSEVIKAALDAEFTADSIKIIIQPDKAETAADGSAIATGSFHVIGKSKETNEAFDEKGKYTNTLVKENGKWKISKSSISSM